MEIISELVLSVNVLNFLYYTSKMIAYMFSYIPTVLALSSLFRNLVVLLYNSTVLNVLFLPQWH